MRLLPGSEERQLNNHAKGSRASMKGQLKLLLIGLLAAAAFATHAASLCAVVEAPYFSRLPGATGPEGKPDGQLKKGQHYAVSGVKGDWAMIELDERSAWTSSKNFGTTGPCAPKPITKQSKASRCACGSGNACVGPRGGKYCMTANGNKQYVK